MRKVEKYCDIFTSCDGKVFANEGGLKNHEEKILFKEVDFFQASFVDSLGGTITVLVALQVPDGEEEPKDASNLHKLINIEDCGFKRKIVYDWLVEFLGCRISNRKYKVDENGELRPSVYISPIPLSKLDENDRMGIRNAIRDTDNTFDEKYFIGTYQFHREVFPMSPEKEFLINKTEIRK